MCTQLRRFLRSYGNAHRAQQSQWQRAVHGNAPLSFVKADIDLAASFTV